MRSSTFTLSPGRTRLSFVVSSPVPARREPVCFSAKRLVRVSTPCYISLSSVCSARETRRQREPEISFHFPQHTEVFSVSFHIDPKGNQSVTSSCAQPRPRSPSGGQGGRSRLPLFFSLLFSCTPAAASNRGSASKRQVMICITGDDPEKIWRATLVTCQKNGNI